MSPNNGPSMSKKMVQTQLPYIPYSTMYSQPSLSPIQYNLSKCQQVNISNIQFNENEPQQWAPCMAV